jgi:tetratricopeptide (TPR) repeat protein
MKKINPLNFFLIPLFLISFNSNTSAQEIDILPYLKQIEEGNRDTVLLQLKELKSKNPNSPSLLYLEGLLTEDGKQAVSIYTKIVDKYPKSKYADAAIYRIFSYYYALDEYDAARGFWRRLKKDYPSSPYINIAERNIPKNELIAEEIENKVTQNDIKKETKKATEEIYKFTIQAGAFTNPQNALTLKKDFVNAGYFSEIKDKVVGGTNFKVVYVGKFTSEEDAISFLKIINSEFKLEGRIINLH